MPKSYDYDRFPKRKHPRLKQYDYATPNYYFITICTKNKACIFGSPEKLNRCGKIAEDGILNIEKHFVNIKVDKYVVMPNHIHLILMKTRIGTKPEITVIELIMNNVETH